MWKAVLAALKIYTCKFWQPDEDVPEANKDAPHNASKAVALLFQAQQDAPHDASKAVALLFQTQQAQTPLGTMS